MSIQSQRSDLRLPSYREGFVIRYHPYPRTEKRVQDTDLMVSVSWVSSCLSAPPTRRSSRRSIIATKTTLLHKTLENKKYCRFRLKTQHGRPYAPHHPRLCEALY